MSLAPDTSAEDFVRASTATREVYIMRVINLAALLGLLLVFSGSLELQVGFGEQPCPLCLIQRAGLVGLGIGPLLNLMWGLRPAHYAISILGALVTGAGATRQILLHIATPGDPGFGPAVMGYHLYTWAFITSVIGAAGCAILLLFKGQFQPRDHGVLIKHGWMRLVTIAFAVWLLTYVFLIAVFILPECGLGMCPDDPTNTPGVGGIRGWTFLLPLGIFSFLVGAVLNAKTPLKRPRIDYH